MTSKSKSVNRLIADTLMFASGLAALGSVIWLGFVLEAESKKQPQLPQCSMLDNRPAAEWKCR